jgi:formylglycine-generating enzyme required for sulfatase activity
MQLVLVPRGTFWMGDRRRQRQVEIPREFYLGSFPVTQGQWQAVMGRNPSWFSRSGGGDNMVEGIADADLSQFPVEGVAWCDVQEFLSRLNAREKDRGFLCRLPDEAEWEYSCRGGATSKEGCAFHFYFSQPTNNLSYEQANFGGGRRAGSLKRTSKVGSYQPNRLGIYDMHGNVSELCEDPCQARGSALWLRGGGWNYSADTCRASARALWLRGGGWNYSARFPNTWGNPSVGFRLVAVPSGE